MALEQVLENTEPRLRPPLDESFRPAVLFHRAFRKRVGTGGVPLVVGLERENGQVFRYPTMIFPDEDLQRSSNSPRSEANYQHVERLVKFLLWQRGAYKIHIGGPQTIGEQIARTYSPDGVRKFDHHFMGDQVYRKKFEVIHCRAEEVPTSSEKGYSLGRHLDGCRIGFDLGASDRKVSAVVDGKVVYSEEVIWEPRKHADPEYHYREILTALKTAASKMPRVDAIGGSSAGIYIDNRPMVASLFRAIPPERYGEIRDLLMRIRDELQVPLEVINDGDVTALAGSMSIGENGILGIALGSSEAAGYVDTDGHIMGWLNELAFAPIDYSPSAPLEEWSGDRGCGASYFSQQCAFRLASRAGIDVPTELTDADKLKVIQEKLEAGHEGAARIWESMGIYLGYGLAHYAEFYDIKHVLILGRCTSGRGGDLLLAGVKAVLEQEFPDLAASIQIHLPDEKIRRIGQSVAAASLPAIHPKNQESL
jgi:predicted NBD/HSP70 family sugar kinase